MNSTETREMVVGLIAAEIEAGSVLASRVAKEIAETIVQGLDLLEHGLLFANGGVHAVVETNWKGPDASGEANEWAVYTHLDEEEWEGDDEVEA